MQFSNAEAAMMPSANWRNAFFKRGAAGHDFVEEVGITEMMSSS